MLKLKEMKNVKINNYADFTNWNLTEKEFTDYIKNLTLNDIQIDDFNNFEFIKYNVTVRVFIYKDGYNRITINIDEIFYLI